MPRICGALLAACAALAASTDVFVMLPLDTFANDGSLKNKVQLGDQLDQLKSANVDGFMADVWWGITERSPKEYNFDSTKELLQMAKDQGLHVQIVASFHQCGGNVGDACDIPLPAFLQQHEGIWYKDQEGNEDREYVSLFADDVTVGGRTPLQMYADWLEAFATTFSEEMGGLIREVQVGLGPAGELRYPGYQLAHWSFCGVGAFQCWDAHALASFRAAAEAAGHSDWTSPPTDAGGYNSRPGASLFWQSGFKGDYGRFFLDWYFSSLKKHGRAVLSAARRVLGDNVSVAGKISGIHWWYKDETHAAEATAGYYNTNGRDAYRELAEEVFAPSRATVDFTCLEMTDSEQDQSCSSGPQELVRQVVSSAQAAGLPFSGENALPRYDAAAFRQIASYRASLESFTYLRLTSTLLFSLNFVNFRDFVDRMHGVEPTERLRPELLMLILLLPTLLALLVVLLVLWRRRARALALAANDLEMRPRPESDLPLSASS